jgi:hypothetical protein
MRRPLSVLALVFATGILGLRIRAINTPPELVGIAPRTAHVLYLDSLRTALLTFAEQYGRPVFQYDTTSPVTGHGRIQLYRLHQALFDPRVVYAFGDQGFSLDWRGDPKPRQHSAAFRRFGAGEPVIFPNPWPPSAAEYARLRRLFITPEWPDPPQRRVNRARNSPVPPHGESFISLIASP